MPAPGAGHCPLAAGACGFAGSLLLIANGWGSRLLNNIYRLQFFALSAMEYLAGNQL